MQKEWSSNWKILYRPIEDLLLYGLQSRRLNCSLLIRGLLFSGLLLSLSVPPLNSTLVLLLPIAIVWRKRQNLLASQANLMAGWFSYVRLLNWLSLGIWGGWIGLFFAGVNSELETALEPAQTLAQVCFDIALFVVPPMISIASCYGLSHRLFAQIGGEAWTKTVLLQQVMWSQLRSVLPLALFFSGCRLFFSQQITLATVLFGAVYLSQTALTCLSRSADDLRIQALTTGELRDRIFELAQLTGITLKQIYIVPSGRRAANALALQGGNVMLSEQLLHYLNRREIDAIVAHELAHLKFKHPQTLQLIVLTAVLGLLLSQSIAFNWLPNFLPNFLIVSLGALLLLVYYAYSRRFEHEADSLAIQLTHDPAAMITGLIKLADLTRTPLDWSRGTRFLMPHPSLRQRVQAIGQEHGLSSQQIQQLLVNPSNAINNSTDCETCTPAQNLAQNLDFERWKARSASHSNSYSNSYYNLPETTRLFSTAFKQTLRWKTTWIRVLGLTLPLAASAALITRLPIGLSSLSLSAYLLGWLGTLAISNWIVNRTSLWGYESLRRRLSQKLRQQGLNPIVWNGTLVGLAPDALPRLYEGLPQWDMGFLFLAGKRLCYVGEQARFALDAAHITHISLQSEHQLGYQSGQWQSSSLLLRWHDGLNQGMFRLQVYEASSLKQMQLQLRVLQQRIEQWQTQPISVADEQIHPFSKLTSPQFGTITSQAYGYKTVVQQFAKSLIKLIAVALAASILLQLPWETQPISLFYVLIGAVFGLLVQFVPLIRAVKKLSLGSI
jgi:Zn-dependent protease with chaperone function